MLGNACDGQAAELETVWGVQTVTCVELVDPAGYVTIRQLHNLLSIVLDAGAFENPPDLGRILVEVATRPGMAALVLQLNACRGGGDDCGFQSRKNVAPLRPHQRIGDVEVDGTRCAVA